MVIPQHIRLGILLIVLAAFIISVQDVTFKTFAGHMSLWQIFAVRGIFAIALFLVLIRASKGPSFSWRDVRVGFAPWPLLRAITFTFTLLAFYAALPKLSFTTVAAANYTAPLFIALLSAVVIGERVGWIGWLGVLIGFGGLLAMLQPDGDGFSPWIFLPVLGALSYAFTHVITRTKCQDLPPLTLALSQNTMMMLSGFVIAGGVIIWSPSMDLTAAEPQLFGPWPALSPADMGLLAIMAAFTVVASTLIARAYQVAPLAIVATFEYSYLLFAAFWDSLAGDLPGPLGLTGALMVFLAGMLILKTTNPSGDNRPS